jgi:hypothetical protein
VSPQDLMERLAATDPVADARRGGGVRRPQPLIIFDAETYLPREQRLFDRTANGLTTTVVWDYLTYERLPLNKKTSALLDFNPTARAKCRPGTERIDRKGSLGFPNPCAR